MVYISGSVLQAMDMISIAQSTGDISADIYRQKSAKPIATPQLAGLEKHNQKLQEEMQAAQNPFTHGTSTSAATVPNGALYPHCHAVQNSTLQAMLLLVLSAELAANSRTLRQNTGSKSLLVIISMAPSRLIVAVSGQPDSVAAN